MYVCMYFYIHVFSCGWVLGKTNHQQVLTTSSRHASGTSPGERHFGWMGEWMGWMDGYSRWLLLAADSLDYFPSP